MQRLYPQNVAWWKYKGVERSTFKYLRIYLSTVLTEKLLSYNAMVILSSDVYYTICMFQNGHLSSWLLINVICPEPKKNKKIPARGPIFRVISFMWNLSNKMNIQVYRISTSVSSELWKVLFTSRMDGCMCRFLITNDSLCTFILVWATQTP